MWQFMHVWLPLQELWWQWTSKWACDRESEYLLLCFELWYVFVLTLDWCIFNALSLYVAINSRYMWLLKTLIFFLHPFCVCYYEICSLISLRRKGISTLSLINYDIYLYVRKNQVNHELFLENRYCRYIWVFFYT